MLTVIMVLFWPFMYFYGVIPGWIALVGLVSSLILCINSLNQDGRH